MFGSLRSKLVASYALVIFLCLILAGSAFVYLLRGYQRQIKLEQLSDLVLPISWQVRLLERVGATPDQMSSYLKDRATEMGVRILLVDTGGQVVDDTTGGLVGDRVQVPPPAPDRGASGGIASITFIRSGGESFVFISATGRPASPSTDRFAARSSSYTVVLAVPEQNLTASWLELAPSLSFAAFVSLFVSIGVAVFLSRSISKPVASITRASEEMARGNYDQNIEVRSRDEIGRLATSFNHMARQVKTSHRTLRDFLANVSHDLRTPLTSVQGFSQAMVDGTIKSPEEYAEAAQIINEEANRMQQMVEDLLLLSKIESGQIPMERASLDLRELLRACVKRAGPQAQLSGVALTLEAETQAHVVGDERRLEQLFRNILDNALRHTPRDGSVTVRLSAQHTHAATNGKGRDAASTNGKGRDAAPMHAGASVAIHNTGSYIPPEDQSRIFERFFQVDKSRARNGDGTGLGLAIAREIVHAHGGTITVESDRENGTTFTVAFGGHQPAIGNF